MASFKFRRVQGVGRQNKFLVEEKRFPSHLPSRPQLESRKQLELHPGQPAWFPRGVDQDAPRK